MRKRRLITLVVVLATVATGLLTFGRSFAKKRAESVGCGNHIVSIMCGARMWANDHNNRFPPNLLAMSNEVNSPVILHCPGDHARPRVRTWVEFTDANTSYEVVSPGALETDTETVFLRCRVHGHLGYVDTTVFDGRQRRMKKIF
jgi:hypothetical protein